MTIEAVERVLAAARETIAKRPYCWAITPGAAGGANARGMGRLTHVGTNEWTVWFFTDRRSRKAGEVRDSGRMTVGYDVDDSFVALVGRAVVVEDRSLIEAHWQESWDRLVEGGKGNPNVVFIKAEIDRIETCIGLWAATIERDRERQWRLVSDRQLGVSAA